MERARPREDEPRRTSSPSSGIAGLTVDEAKIVPGGVKLSHRVRRRVPEDPYTGVVSDGDDADRANPRRPRRGMTAYDIDKSGRLVRNSPSAGAGRGRYVLGDHGGSRGDPRNPKSVAADAFDADRNDPGFAVNRYDPRDAGGRRRGRARRRDDGRLARGMDGYGRRQLRGKGRRQAGRVPHRHHRFVRSHARREDRSVVPGQGSERREAVRHGRRVDGRGRGWTEREGLAAATKPTKPTRTGQTRTRSIRGGSCSRFRRGPRRGRGRGSRR